jgi:hypothetical protein
MRPVGAVDQPGRGAGGAPAHPFPPEGKKIMSNLEALEIEVDKPSRMVILHPKTNLPMKDIEGKEAYIDVYSSDSVIAVKFKREIKTARLRTRNPNSVTGETLDSESAELLAALTAGWYLVDFSGNQIDLPFSRDSAAKMYSNNRNQWLTDQVDAFSGARGNFLGASSER